MSVYTEAAKLLQQDLVQLETETSTHQGLVSYYFVVNKHKVHLFDVKLENKQVVHRWQCDCMRGVLISPKYATYCKHVLAAQYWLIRRENEKI